MKEIPASLSLQTLTQRLRLEISEIKKLYDFKIRTIKNDEKYLKLAKSILFNELNQLQNEVNHGRVIFSYNNFSKKGKSFRILNSVSCARRS